MPITYFAHQAPVLAAERARRHWWDATAACVGSMSPDWMFALGSHQPIVSHDAKGLVVFCLPISVVVAVVARRWAIATVAAHLPDLGPFRLRSWGALASRRPALWATTVSATVGAASHLVADAFTHEGRWRVVDRAIDGVVVPIAGHRYALADVLQVALSAGGSIIALVLLWRMAATEVPARRYGADEVARARGRVPEIGQRVAFLAIIALALAWGAAWASFAEAALVFALPPAAALGALVAGLVPTCRAGSTTVRASTSGPRRDR